MCACITYRNLKLYKKSYTLDCKRKVVNVIRRADNRLSCGMLESVVMRTLNTQCYTTARERTVQCAGKLTFRPWQCMQKTIRCLNILRRRLNIWHIHFVFCRQIRRTVGVVRTSTEPSTEPPVTPLGITRWYTWRAAFKGQLPAAALHGYTTQAALHGQNVQFYSKPNLR